MVVILNLQPIEIYIQGIALRSNLGLKKNENWALIEGEVTKQENHKVRVIKLAKEISEIFLLSDKFINKQRGECNFITMIKPKNELINHQFKLTPSNDSTIHVFTDGSKTSSGCGFGYYTKGTQIKQQGYRHLGKIAHSFSVWKYGHWSSCQAPAGN